MIPEDLVSRMYIAVSPSNEGGHGVGVELYRKTPEGPSVYYFASLYYDKAKCPSIRQALFAGLAETLPEVPDKDELIFIFSNLRYFKHDIYEVKRKAGMYSGGTRVHIKHFKKLNGDAHTLAQDATLRKTSISERLV